MLDRYTDRLNRLYANGKCLVLYFFCYAEFLRYYDLAETQMVDENGYQPEVLLDELVEKNHMLKVNYPNNVLLMSRKCRKAPAVLKFYIPNRHTHPE